MRKNEREKLGAIETLRETLKPGSVVYTVLKHVSRSGMMREISLHTVENGSICWITGLASTALGMKRGKLDGIRIGGVGMDMGFALVYELSHALYRDGFLCSGEGCPSNDHSNGHRYEDTMRDRYGDTMRDRTPCKRETLCKHADHKSAGWHDSGGYALRHRWI